MNLTCSHCDRIIASKDPHSITEDDRAFCEQCTDILRDKIDEPVIFKNWPSLSQKDLPMTKPAPVNTISPALTFTLKKGAYIEILEVPCGSDTGPDPRSIVYGLFLPAGSVPEIATPPVFVTINGDSCPEDKLSLKMVNAAYKAARAAFWKKTNSKLFSRFFKFINPD